MKRLLVVLLLTGLLTGCSGTGSSSSTTTLPPFDDAHKSISMLQLEIDTLTTDIAKDQTQLQTDANLDGGLGQQFCQNQGMGNCQNGVYVSTTSQDQAKLKRDQFNLQVAQDYLTKAEG